mgnify:CR=1 FL=1
MIYITFRTSNTKASGWIIRKGGKTKMVQAKRKKKQKTIPRNSELIDQLASEYYIKATPELDRAA